MRLERVPHPIPHRCLRTRRQKFSILQPVPTESELLESCANIHEKLKLGTLVPLSSLEGFGPLPSHPQETCLSIQ